MAHTTKPCPGCGQVDRYRPADKVCDTCKKKLARIADIEAEATQLRATVAAALKAETKPHRCHIPEKGYGMVGVNNRLAESVEYTNLRATTETMILALLAPLDRGRVDEWRNNAPIPVTGDQYLPPDLRCVEATDEGAKAASLWWRSLKAWSQACYGAGVEDGRDLLGQLAAGEMTVTQVNDRAYELVERKRRF